jgi:hypothetical protein
MFACASMGTIILPWANQGSLVVLPAIFGFLLASFTLQLTVAVITESIGWTISVMVAGNVGLNVFLMKLFAMPTVAAVTKSDELSWPDVILQILVIEFVFVIVALAMAFFFQTRQRDLV